MCTAINLVTPQGYSFFGRTMDFSYPLNPGLYYIPRGHQWQSVLNTHSFDTHYSVLGIGEDISPVVFPEGVNENGFAAAALYFPGYASYDALVTDHTGKASIAAFEVVKFLLSQCATVDEAAVMIKQVQIVGVGDPVTRTVAPLHWIIADKSGKCMVIEKTIHGLYIMNNPIGVLANSPDFYWHMTNLRNYMNVTPEQDPSSAWGNLELTPFGQSAGLFGLPGDYTAPSRFARIAFQKSHTVFPDDIDQAAMTCFRIMETVSIPKGVVITERGSYDYTQYTTFVNLKTQEYYIKTYLGSQIYVAKMPRSDISGTQIISMGNIIQPGSFKQLC